MAIQIHDLIRKESGVEDPYAQIKKMTNEACSNRLIIMEEIMSSSLNPLLTAIQLAIAGNIIDCGAYDISDVSQRDLDKVTQDALTTPVAGDNINRFQELINSSKRILYIGDNAGECFFDRPLISMLPAEKVTYAVRGRAVLNDATMEDAYAAAIHELCPVIDTGDNAPGVLLERCADDFITAFENSDLIISKGQGNYESLSEIKNKTIVFLTKVKCEIIAEDIGYALNSHVIKINRSTKTGNDISTQN